MKTYIVDMETTSLHGGEPDAKLMEDIRRGNPGLSLEPRGDGSFRGRVVLEADDKVSAGTTARDLVVQALRAAGREVSAESISWHEVKEQDDNTS